MNPSKITGRCSVCDTSIYIDRAKFEASVEDVAQNYGYSKIAAEEIIRERFLCKPCDWRLAPRPN